MAMHSTDGVIWFTWATETHKMYHLILMMTSFSTFMSFRVNELPCVLMGRLMGAGRLSHIESRLFPLDWWPVGSQDAPTLPQPLLAELKTLREVDNNQTESICQELELSFLVWPSDHTLAVTLWECLISAYYTLGTLPFPVLNVSYSCYEWVR